MKKGITPVISLVLLLLIVVVIVGIAAGQLMGIFSQTGESIEEGSEDVEEKLRKVPKIDKATCEGSNLTIHVRGMGSGEIGVNETTVYKGDEHLGGNDEAISGGEVVTLSFGVNDCNGTVEITGPAGTTDDYKLGQ